MVKITCDVCGEEVPPKTENEQRAHNITDDKIHSTTVVLGPFETHFQGLKLGIGYIKARIVRDDGGKTARLDLCDHCLRAVFMQAISL